MTPPTGHTATLHASAVLIGEGAILIRGASGSGKSHLARMLLAQARAAGIFARLLGDDRIIATRIGDAVVLRPHPAIAGLVEIRGVGLVPVSHEPAARLEAIVDLGASEPQRLPEPTAMRTDVMGLYVPLMTQKSRDADPLAVLTWFFGLRR